MPPKQARLGKILDKLLQNSVSQRYQSADQVLQDLVIPDIAISKNHQIVKSQPQPATLVSEPLHHNLLEKIMPWIVKPTGDNLLSAVGVDYTNLQHLLAAQKWKEADLETWVVLCQALGKIKL